MRKKTLDATDQPDRVHCKRGTKSARNVFYSRTKCQDVVARFKDDGFPYSVNTPCCVAKTTILVRQSRSPECREIGRRFAPLWDVFATKLQENFPERFSEGTYVVPTIDFRAHVNVYDRRSGIGKPVFRLAPIGYEQNSPSFLVICVNLYF